MYPAFRIGTRAVALMGIRTHLCLIRGPVVEQPFFSTDFECVCSSVPCIYLNRELVNRLNDLFDQIDDITG